MKNLSIEDIRLLKSYTKILLYKLDSYEKDIVKNPSKSYVKKFQPLFDTCIKDTITAMYCTITDTDKGGIHHGTI